MTTRTTSYLLALLLAGTLTGCSASAEEFSPQPVLVEEGVLTVCTDMPYEPFEFEKDGEPVGFDIDLVQEVADRLDLRLSIVDSDFDAIANGEALNSDTCDLEISAMTINAERARVLDFSSPYFNAAQAMVVGGGSEVATLGDLAGRRVGVQEGTTGELYLTDHAPGNAEIVPFGDAAAMTDAVVAGDVAAAVYDNTVVGQIVEEHPQLTLAAEFDTGEQYGMAVKKDGNVELLRVVNSVLADLDESGRYDELYERWFGDAGR